METLRARPLVSILIPAYNAAPWVRQAVESALAQEYEPKEVIVADDGSTDGTLAILRRFGEAIRLEALSHAGGNAARNRLTELARGEWLQYLDADDALLPHKIRNQMRFLADRRGELDVICSPPILREEPSGRETPLELADDGDGTVNYIRWGAIQTSSLLFRRSAVCEVGAWKIDQPACQEHELLLRLIRAGKRLGIWNEAATIYRVYGTGTVSRKNPLRTIRLRMELTDELEAFLQGAGRLTDTHRKALYIARMESARSAWIQDPEFARELARKAASRGRWWVQDSPALPPSFQITAFLFGFEAAQRIAAWRRGRKLKDRP